MTGYDDRDGFIWMDGKLVDWRGANVHVPSHHPSAPDSQP